MEIKEAQGYIRGARDYRKEIGKPLRDPTTPPEIRAVTIGELKILHDLDHEDPNYRQALRVISELRSQREIKQPKVEVTEKKAEFPSDPEERYKAVISSIGNHAGKQITFLSISSIPGTITTPPEMHSAFLENSQGVWKTGGGVQKDHASSSLAPIGMVAKEVGIRNGSNREVVGYTQTEAGRKYGDPIAKFLLKYAAEHNISLQSIFGATGSTENRTPYYRSLILEYLSQAKDNKTIRIADIQKALSHKYDEVSVKSSLGELQKAGLLIFDTVNKETMERFLYNTTDTLDNSKDLGGQTGIALRAIKSLQAAGISEFNLDTIFSEIIKDNPDFKREDLAKKLFSIRKLGYIIQGEFKYGERLSSVVILQEGIDMVKDLLQPIHIALSDTPEGEVLRKEWKNIPWKEYAPTALAKLKESSSLANKVEASVSLQTAIDIVANNPGIRTTEITQKFKELGISASAASSASKRLFEEGVFRKDTVKGNFARWYVAEEKTDNTAAKN